MTFETLLYEQDGHILTITLNRPKSLNALSRQMGREITRAWADFKADPEAWVCILTGAGERALCAGMDLKEEAQAGNMNTFPDMEGARNHLSAHEAGVYKPVICAVNGIVGGGGLMFVAGSDIIIAAENAEFFNPGVSVGVVSPYGPILLTRRMPFEAVMRMFLVGSKERLCARRALELGLVSEVVPQAELIPTARRIAQCIAENSPTAVGQAKRALWESLQHPLSAALDNSEAIMAEYRGHPDLTEGPRAFAEKRKPVWMAR